MTENLEESIRDGAKSPRRVKGDSGEVEQHSLRDQIAADQYLASKNAMKKKGMGVVFKKLVPHGTD